MAYVLKEGRRLLGLNMAQCVYAPGIWAHIFIDCPTCDQSIGLYFDSNAESDAFKDKDFAKIVHSRGWDFVNHQRIACPSCRKAQSGPTPHAPESPIAAPCPACGQTGKHFCKSFVGEPAIR